MAEAVLSVTLETLRDLLLEEAKFLSGVSDQVREIQEQLEMMKSLLKDADQRQYADETIRTWVRQVRRLAYRTEDVLQTYGVEVVSKKGRGFKNVLKRFACIFSESSALHKVGVEIVAIKSKITSLNASRRTFGLNDLNEGQSSKEAKERQRLLRQTYAHQVEEHFVGMKDDIRDLVSLITDDERDHRVISIWGIGGLGKTTLARKIFNHKVVRSSFESFAWVCITQQCEINKVLKDILEQLLGKDAKDMQADPAAMVREIYNILEKKKCLLVLDDIWKVEDWEILRQAFSVTNTSSKVLLTTRTGEVAIIGHCYKLNYLAAEEGWELLQRKALIKGKERDIPAFERIGKEIVDKCGRLPLAISVLGGILREKSSPREWEMVSKGMDSYMERGKGNQGASNFSVHQVLGLSYDELPYYLKPCFLYMGNYKEDQEILVVELYQLWIAEGLVLSEDRRREESMMDVAERYLDELASRCMVEIEMDDVSIDPTLKRCRLHDLMRELCLAKGKEEEFLKVIDFSSSNQSLPAMDDHSSLSHDDYVRRLGMNIYEESRPTKQEILEAFKQVKGQYVRALFLEENLKDDVLIGIWGYVPVGSIVKQFKLLRVLRLERCEFELSEEISQLIYLRYLSVYDSKVRKLPSSISNLSYLQTLDLRVYWESRIYLPNIFWKMKRLKHIYLPLGSYEVSEKLEFKDMSELETLHGFQSTLRTPGHLSGLTNLRYFTGSFDAPASSQFEDEIHSWKKIKWLKFEIINSYYSDFESDQVPALLRKLLLWENLNDLVIDNIPIGNFPPYQPNFCPHLSQLSLRNTKIEEDPMQFLKQLPNLRGLALCRDAFLGEEMFCDARAFPQLIYLNLESLPNLMKWRVDEGAVPKLSRLEIWSCPKLETITEGLNLSALKELSIYEMPEEFKKKYKMLHEQERKKLNG